MTCKACEQQVAKVSEWGYCLACLREATQGCTELTCMYHGPLTAQIVDTFGPEARYGSGA